MDVKRKKIKIFGLFMLVFAVLLLVSEIAVAVINNFLANREVGDYAIVLVIIPAVSLLTTGLILWLGLSFYKYAKMLIDGLDRVAHGDFSTELIVRRRSYFSKIAENFNKMTKELGSVETLREDFVRALSHEIKTPLCSINGFASLLLEGGVTEEESKKYLSVIADEADRLRRFADGMLMLSKLENQQFAGETAPIKLDGQIRDCAILLQRDWERKNIEIDLGLEPVTVNTDGALLRNVWVNLLSNAVKFTPEGGKIEVTLKKEGTKAEVVIRDSGAGIAEEDLPRVFEKFYRSESAKSTEGNGIGLAVCKRICSLLGCEISCLKEEKGAAFKVVIPI